MDDKEYTKYEGYASAVAVIIAFVMLAEPKKGIYIKVKTRERLHKNKHL